MIKLLFVDDEKGLCGYLKELFNSRGYHVYVATDSEQALSIVKKEKPNLIFLDIRMLGMSGLQLLREIKRIDSRVKVNMITVQDDERTRQEARELGAEEFIAKPFISDHLEEVVRKQVSTLVEEETDAGS